MESDRNREWLSKWLVIVNPNSGSRKGKKDWGRISGHLKEEGFSFTDKFTLERGHAVHLSEQLIADEGYRKIIVVGGDGTMNEVINGVFRQKRFKTEDIIIGMIPIGTGNDWGRMYNIKGGYEKTIRIIKNGLVFTQDAGLVTYYDKEELKKRYFVNVAGTGYDALVAERTNRLKEQGKGNTLTYLAQVAKGLFSYKQGVIHITSGEEEIFKGGFFTVSVGICRYNGSGMKQLPEAIPDDGYFDIMFIKKARKSYILRNVYKIYDGSHLKLPIVMTHRSSTVKLKSVGSSRLKLEADGESLGKGPFEFSIVPASIRLLVPDSKHDFNHS